MSRIVHMEVEPPLHLEATVRLLQRRPRSTTDRWEDRRYLRVFATGEGLILTATRNRGSCDEPRLELSFPDRAPSAPLAKELAKTLRKILGLDSLPSAFALAAKRHPALRGLAADLRGMRPPRFPSLMEAFGRIVPYQQLSLDSGTATVNRLVECFGPALAWGGAGAEPLYVFPSAPLLARADPEDLRATGLSYAKARTLIEIGAAIAAGGLEEATLEALSTSAAFEQLLKLRGVGPWTASLFLLRGLGRLDAFPAGDVGANKGLANLVGADPATFVAEDYARSFGDERGMLYFYSLGAQLLERGLIGPAGRS